MAADPHFSVIIPTLNERTFLPLLLTDLYKQKDRSFEVIVVDGQSSDGTAAAADRFKNALDMHVLTVDKRNVSYQRNCGAAKSRGTYLIFLDADSRVSSSFITNTAAASRSSRPLILIPLFSIPKKPYQDALIFNIANFSIELSRTLGTPISAGGSMIFQRDFFHFLGGFNEKLFFSEDYEIIARARKSGVVARVAKHVKVHFSMRRFKKEGHFAVLKKYALAWIYHFSNNAQGIDKKIFDYSMGGAQYANLKKKFDRKNYFSHLKSQFDRFIQEVYE